MNFFEKLTSVLTSAKSESEETMVAAAGIEPATQGFSVLSRTVTIRPKTTLDQYSRAFSHSPKKPPHDHFAKN